MSNTPKVAAMEVFPVAGKDCMELNLSGAHAPYFTRNVVVLTDDRGNTGIGEVPGGQKITKALEDVKHLVEGTSVANYKMTLRRINEWLSANIKDDVRGQQTFDLRTGVHVVTAVETPLLDLLGQYLEVPMAALLGDGIQRDRVRFLSYLFYVGDRKKPTCPTTPSRTQTALGTGCAMRRLSPPTPSWLWPRPPMTSTALRTSSSKAVCWRAGRSSRPYRL